MSPDLAKQVLPLIAAIAEGKTLEYRRSVYESYSDTAVYLSDAHELICSHPERFRVKREEISYRRYISTDINGRNHIEIVMKSDRTTPEQIDNFKHLVRWIDNDWITEVV